MIYIAYYKTIDGLDDIVMASDGEALIGLWFKESVDDVKYKNQRKKKDLPIFDEAFKWLDAYFKGKPLKKMPKIKIEGSTQFRNEVIEIMCNIPYGETKTYKEIAKELVKKKGIKRMSAQAVGGAVGWNPICIIIPCHRVIGSDNSLTGYRGGLNNKRKLLDIEKLHSKI